MHLKIILFAFLAAFASAAPQGLNDVLSRLNLNGGSGVPGKPNADNLFSQTIINYSINYSHHTLTAINTGINLPESYLANVLKTASATGKKVMNRQNEFIYFIDLTAFAITDAAFGAVKAAQPQGM